MSSMGLSYEADTEREFKNTEYQELLDNLDYSKFLVKNIDERHIDDELLENIFEFTVLLNDKFDVYKEHICFNGYDEIYSDLSQELKINLNYTNDKFQEFDKKLEELQHNGYLDFNMMLPVLRELLIISIEIHDKMIYCNDLCLEEEHCDEMSNIFGDMRI